MLNTKPNIDDADTFYAELIAIYDKHTDIECEVISARLVLILANHIGDRKILHEALKLSKNVLTV